jgi:hypothetical protein
VHSYAVGHGTSVAWQETDDRTAALSVTTSAIPRYELLLTDSNPDIPTDHLAMHSLATQDRGRTAAALRKLTDGYDAWIGPLEGQALALPATLQPIAADQLAQCREALGRMRAGITQLEGDDQAFRAFQLANLAMLRQRARMKWAAEGRPAEGPVEDDSHQWRPFQIAFLLLNLDGIADPEHPDRALVDLLWFPTGGGKTEAYLGLIAFTILLRRMRNPSHGDGVTVLMRYTLRLLTIQQFERAASLICALEDIRVNEGDLGSSPISIGLWVGKDGTPQNLKEAQDALDTLRNGGQVLQGNPVQVRTCPWCGTRLDHRGYYCDQRRHRLVIRCRNKECQFNEGPGLPIYVVDEDIYHERPTLVIGTADKFATLPWIAHGYAIFGTDAPSPPPELIVQDELHLISGPLGTLAGLYEAAIDILCTRESRRPKIVASTATIRRAQSQAKALFDREMRQFPPSGLDAGNSYFATTASRNEKATRLYVGVMAPGKSQSTLMIRAYAALMQAVYEGSAPDDALDPYWTLVGYFNSLRVLGGARIQVLDDVNERLGVVAGEGGPRPIPHAIELTSREPSSAIPGHLEALARERPDEETLDYVLATNMISVGVDVNRLGLMVVMGQPQATAEYIQATSRVGRQYPGVVVMLYNAARSRDRSHYESFPTYHASLYRQVESTSVTPFSPRARDRALHAVLLTIARCAVPDLREGAGARNLEPHVETLRTYGDLLAKRAERVAEVEGADTTVGGAVRRELDAMLDRWRARIQETNKLVYANKWDPDNALLTSLDVSQGEGIQTPSSLRDVDRESNLYLVYTD